MIHEFPHSSIPLDPVLSFLHSKAAVCLELGHKMAVGGNIKVQQHRFRKFIAILITAIAKSEENIDILSSVHTKYAQQYNSFLPRLAIKRLKEM